MLLQRLIVLACLSVASTTTAAVAATDQVVSLGWTEQPRVDGAGVTLEADRAYGLVVGDRFEHRIHLRPEAGVQLEPGSVPAVQNFPYGLERQRVQVLTHSGGEEPHYEIRIGYQIFDAPEQPRVHTVPEFELRLTDGNGGESVGVPIPEWPFVVTPLIGGAIDRTPGEGRMLPAIAPEPMDTVTPRRGLVLTASGGVALAFLVWGLPILRHGRQRSAFVGALSDLRRLRREQPSDATARAVRLVHGALNRCAGETVFLGGLPTLLDRHPWLRPAQAELEEFFELSAEAFYSDGAGPADEQRTLQELEKLLRRCRQLERRR